MELRFSKYQRTGNDFILMDNRSQNISLSPEQIKKLCDRRFGIGADGLMLLMEGCLVTGQMFDADGPADAAKKAAAALIDAYVAKESAYLRDAD